MQSANFANMGNKCNKWVNTTHTTSYRTILYFIPDLQLYVKMCIDISLIFLIYKTWDIQQPHLDVFCLSVTHCGWGPSNMAKLLH